MASNQQLSDQEYRELLAACLFRDGKGESIADADKAQLVGMMGRAIPDGGAGFGTTGEYYFVPKAVVLNPEFPGQVRAWDRMVEASLFEDRGSGYLVRAGLLSKAEQATGVSLKDARTIYENTRASSNRQIG